MYFLNTFHANQHGKVHATYADTGQIQMAGRIEQNIWKTANIIPLLPPDGTALIATFLPVVSASKRIWHVIAFIASSATANSMASDQTSM